VQSKWRKTHYVSLDFLCAIFALTSLLSIASSARGQAKNPKTNRPEQNFLNGRPLTIDNLIKLISAVNSKIEPESRVTAGLKARGIDFPPTPEALSRLINAGASEPVLALVRELGAKSLPPTPLSNPVPSPPQKPKLRILIKCEPAECQVRLGDGPFQTTSSGELLFEGLDTGRLIVESQKDGFRKQVEVVDLQSTGTGAPVRHDILLLPTEELQRRWGQQLIQDMVSAVQLRTGPRKITGTLKILSSPAVTLDVIAQFEAHATAAFELQFATGSATISCKSGRCFASIKPASRIKIPLGGGKKLKLEEIEPFVPDVEALLAYEFEELTANLFDGRADAMAMADPATSAEPKTFRVPRASGVYTVQLNSGMRPVVVAYESSLGVGAGIRVNYSEFKKFGDREYPSATELIFGRDHRAMVFQARTVERGAILQKTASPQSR
jgi:hypothetical protein